MSAPRWQDRAACRGLDVELFFPERGDDGAGAIAICARCDVREECLAFSMQIGAREGVWGGTSERERRRRLDRRGTKDEAYNLARYLPESSEPGAERQRRYRERLRRAAS